MIGGQITLDGFAYAVLEGKAHDKDGQELPIQLLRFSDKDSGTHVQIAFTQEDWETFVGAISGEKKTIITPSRKLPVALASSQSGKSAGMPIPRSPFTRNGRIRS